MSKIATIKKELNRLIKKKTEGLETQAEKNHAINQAQKEINMKYGKGWRQKYSPIVTSTGYDFRKPAMAQDLGDEWEYYPWTADDF